MGRMVIGLASDSMERLVVASVATGGAVALDMEVDITSCSAAPMRSGSRAPRSTTARS